MKKFEDIFRIYSEEVPARSEDEGHKPNQVREKYAEIIEIVGLDNRLLRVDYRNETIPVDERLKSVSVKTGYVIPEGSVKFVVDLLKKHTSSEYKSIRKADFSKVSGKELEGIVNGFTKMLSQLGYPLMVVEEQKRIMEKRFQLKSHLALEKIQEECRKLIKQAESYVGSSSDMTTDDEDCFLQYMASSLTGLGNYMESIHEAYEDSRLDERLKLTKEKDKNISKEDIILEYQENEAINADSELQEWVHKLIEIIGCYDFVKNKRKDFNVINERIKERLMQHHKDVYGDRNVETETQMILRRPMDVLYEAIIYTENDDLQEYRCKRLAETREQIEFESEEAKQLVEKVYAEFYKGKMELEKQVSDTQY